MFRIKIPFTDFAFDVRIPILDDFNDAKTITEKAKRDFENAKERLEAIRQEAQDSLELYGRTKLNIFDNNLRHFVVQFGRIKNAELKAIQSDDQIAHNTISVIQMKSVDFKTIDGLKALVAGGGAGAVSGAIAFGAVSTFAVASTGTAIATLSGVAATNATLAFLGGGSLAAGGLGVAGGTAVLGGLVAIPVLIVGGFVMNAKAKEALENAKVNKAEVKRFVSECDAAIAALNSIKVRSAQLKNILIKLDGKFSPMIERLSQVIDKHARGNLFKRMFYFCKKILVRGVTTLGIRSPQWLNQEAKASYLHFSKIEKEELMVAVAVAQTIKNIMDTNILDDAGLVTKESQKVAAASQNILIGLN